LIYIDGNGHKSVNWTFSD